MPNVPPTPREEVLDAVSTGQRVWPRVLLWAVVCLVLATVFLGYQQVDLAIAWITAKLC